MKKIFKAKKSHYTILIFLIFTSAFLGILMITESNQRNDLSITDRSVNKDQLDDNYKPKFSLWTPKAINPESIKKNDTFVLRVLESINFTVNITDFKSGGANHTTITFFLPEYPGGEYITKEYNMTKIGSSNNWTYTYTPAYNDSLGFVDVRFNIFNATGPELLWLKLNTNEVTANFTIIPNSRVSFYNDEYVSNEYVKDDTLTAFIMIDSSSDYNWNISVSDDNDIGKENILFDVGNDIPFFYFDVNNSFELDRYYYIKINMTKKSTGFNFSEYFHFKVLSTLTLFDTNSIEFIPGSIFRAQIGKVYANVTHVKYGFKPMHINVSLALNDTNGNVIYNQDTINNDDGSFTGTFSIAETRPIGNYRYSLTAKYKDIVVEKISGFITVKNNLPKIDGYEINDYDTDESISVMYGEDLEFDFDVSDIEGVAYISLKLENEEGDDYKITRAYESDLEIVIRTAELITGTWDVNVYVTDTDGVTVGLSDDFNQAPQKITIIPDTLSTIFPWVTLVIGIVLGIILSIGISYHIIKSKKTKSLPKEKKEAKPKKPVRETIPRKVKPAPIQEAAAEKEIIKEKPEEKERRTIAPPRKIKRRLK